MASLAKLCLNIAEEQLAESLKISAEHRSPRPDGGFVLTDDGQRSMKASLIAVAFAAAYFEAVTLTEIQSRFAPDIAQKLDRSEYEVRVSALGISDPKLLQGCKRLRALRREMLHHKEARELFVVQDEAQAAVELVRTIAHRLAEPRPEAL